jgi:hypothetical protein
MAEEPKGKGRKEDRPTGRTAEDELKQWHPAGGFKMSGRQVLKLS